MPLRSLKHRLEVMERAAQAAQITPMHERSYFLPHTIYPRVIVEAFREGNLAVEVGRIVSPERPYGWQCERIAAILQESAAWGDVFVDESEIAAARELLALGWIGFGYSFTEVPPHHSPPRWQVLITHAQTHELYSTDKARYFAVHATGRMLDAAIRVAAWRAGTPITTLDQVAAWLATARPLALSMTMIEGIGPITANALTAHFYGFDLDQLMRADNEKS